MTRLQLRTALLGGLVAMMLGAAPATGQSAASYKAGMAINPRTPFGGSAIGLSPGAGIRPAPLNWRQWDQLRRWSVVGQCVVAADRPGSLALVDAARGSAAADTAQQRIDPVFDACFERSGVVSRGVMAYRRAAVADALGVPARN